MKWLPVVKLKRPRGEIRPRRIFAFFPHLCMDGYIHWLEILVVKEEWARKRHVDMPYDYWAKLSYETI